MARSKRIIRDSSSPEHNTETRKPRFSELGRRFGLLVDEHGNINPDFPMSATCREALKDFKMPPKVAQFLAQESEVTA